MTIQEDMTVKAKKIWSNLINKRTHPLPCDCPVCLYALSREKKIKGMRKPFGMMSFFLNWLIHAVKINYLRKNGKVEEIILYGRKAWQYNPQDYEKAPYLKNANKIIAGLYCDEDLIDFAPDFEKLLNYSYLNFRHWKIEKSDFSKILDELAKERWLDWTKIQPDLQKNWKANWRDFRIAQKAANYIYKQPGKEIISRKLQRHLNVKKSDQERIHDLLRSNFNIECPEKGVRNKTAIYFYKKSKK